MKEPEQVLASGTRVRTNTVLVSDPCFQVAPPNKQARLPDREGVVVAWVPGHGGDVYWVSHGGPIAAYGWWEFELVDTAGQ